jgi:hypothetical protein
MVSALERDYAGARKILESAGQYFRARSEETSRRWYVFGSFLSTMPFLCLGVAAWLSRGPAIYNLLGHTGFLLTLSLAAGALGALISVIARSGALAFDSSAGWQLHYLEAASRIVMGAVSGALIGLAVQSGIFFQSLLTSTPTANIILIIAAFAGGSSERLLGSIISKFDPITEKKTPQ